MFCSLVGLFVGSSAVVSYVQPQPRGVGEMTVLTLLWFVSARGQSSRCWIVRQI
jgi:5,10-methylene-tetrahydrofolate dehydrogenase/methenyl tetrahydrofolate cyclohydrolase